MKKIINALLLVLTSIGHSQKTIPTDYFKNPLDIPIILAGDFGELRGSHFHSGLDIKTKHQTGLAVNASATGTVTRIKVERYGYGKALYVEHPNGYTTVYAHLKRFSPAIEAYVKKQQYKNESYAIELFPRPDEFKVIQGELIAYSGNTGGSTAPHLHFEIRDASQRPMNPMLFGFDVSDTNAPLITDLMVYPISDSSQINQSQYKQNLRFTKQKDGSFMSEKIQAFGPIGFGIATIDRQDGAPNKNGIYKIETSFNGKSNLELVMNKFSFSESSYITRMIDYEYYETKRSRVQKLFIQPNNPLSIFTFEEDKGVINLDQNGTNYVYNIVVSDYKGNKTSLLIPISAEKMPILTPKTVNKTDFFVNINEPLNVTFGKFEVYFPKGVFYEDHYLDLSQKDNILHLHEDIIPVARNITIRYDASGYSAEDRERLYIGTVAYNGGVYYKGAYVDGTDVIAKVGSLDDYTVAMDALPPTVEAIDLKEGKWMSTYPVLKFKIADSGSGISDYRATINGKFILMEYEYKNGELTYDFSDQVIAETENNLKLIVTDNVGNSTTFTSTFFRKN